MECFGKFRSQVLDLSLEVTDPFEFFQPETKRNFNKLKYVRKCHNHNLIKQTFSSTMLDGPASSNSSIFNPWSSSPLIFLLQMRLCLRITMWYVMEKVNGSMIIVWAISSLKTAKVLFSSYRKFQSEILQYLYTI